MPKLNLSNGEARLGVFHENVFLHLEGTANKFETRRATRVHLTAPQGSFEVASLCHPNDQFCKAVGRKTAANKLLALLKENEFNKADRKQVFHAVCPEYSK